MIKIKDISPFALSEEYGNILREKIEVELASNDKVILDFEGIRLFATPFFNASTGYFFLNYSNRDFDDIFKLVNISDLGVNTYNHSRDTAKLILRNKLSTEKIGEITSNTLEEYRGGE